MANHACLGIAVVLASALSASGGTGTFKFPFAGVNQTTCVPGAEFLQAYPATYNMVGDATSMTGSVSFATFSGGALRVGTVTVTRNSPSPFVRVEVTLPAGTAFAINDSAGYGGFVTCPSPPGCGLGSAYRSWTGTIRFWIRDAAASPVGWCPEYSLIEGTTSSGVTWPDNGEPGPGGEGTPPEMDFELIGDKGGGVLSTLMPDAADITGPTVTSLSLPIPMASLEFASVPAMPTYTLPVTGGWYIGSTLQLWVNGVLVAMAGLFSVLCILEEFKKGGGAA